MTTYARDIQAILDRRHDNGADFWAGKDGKIYVGNPFSTIGALCLLHELGVTKAHEAVKGGIAQLVAASRDDGRIKLGPKTPLYPCYTAEASRALCRFGMASSPIVQQTISRFLDTAQDVGGWRCSFSRFGRGPETEHANPGATLYILDVFRHFPEYQSDNAVVDQAVSFLLDHWETRQPIGPCHWGIGSTFLTLEYPFVRYNIFYYVYILSHFCRAISDDRFNDALQVLRSKLNEKDQIVVERPHRALSKFEFCHRNQPSEPATKRYKEICRNIRLASLT